MSNKKLENTLRSLKASSKTASIILKAFAHRERDIRGTKDANGCPQYTMEVARLRTDIYNFGVKDGRSIVVPRKTEVKDADFYAFFTKLAEVGALDVIKAGKEGQPLVVNFHYSVKAMGQYALTGKGELLTCTERDAKNAAQRAQFKADAASAKPNGKTVARQPGVKSPVTSPESSLVGQSGGGLSGKIETAIASKIDDAISKALEKAFGNL